LQLAYNAAAKGDTILVSPAEGTYTGITVTKQVHIVGNGWTSPSASVPSTKITSLTFNTGSEGSSVTGFYSGAFVVNANTDSITIKRNKCAHIWIYSYCTKIVISQNYITGPRSCCDPFRYSCIAVDGYSEVVISNNIITNQETSNASYGIYIYYPGNAIIMNNIIQGDDIAINLCMSESNYLTQTVYNNIVYGGSVGGVDAASFNNISNSTQFPASNGNLQNKAPGDIFENHTAFNYPLKSGSPAIGAGFNGTDCGIYGGDNGFVDNGRTWLPLIYEITVPPTVNVEDGLDVTVKARSGN
jgi:hypothetical protein